MIDEKKLIEEILEHKDKVKACDKRVNEVYELAHDHIIDIINIQPKTDWIPCEERLPDDFMSMKYLTTIKGHFYPEINYYCVVNHKWFSSEKTTKELNVIAWQPLPQPYKKEGGLDE